MLTVKTTVCSLAALGVVAEAVVDNAASELVDLALESVVAAAASVGLEAGTADRDDEADKDVESTLSQSVWSTNCSVATPLKWCNLPFCRIAS